jgi:hypothetical protein
MLQPIPSPYPGHASSSHTTCGYHCFSRLSSSETLRIESLPDEKTQQLMCQSSPEGVDEQTMADFFTDAEQSNTCCDHKSRDREIICWAAMIFHRRTIDFVMLVVQRGYHHLPFPISRTTCIDPFTSNFSFHGMEVALLRSSSFKLKWPGAYRNDIYPLLEHIEWTES